MLEEQSRRGGRGSSSGRLLVVPDGGVDDDSLDNGVGLCGVGTPVQRSGESQRGEQSRSNGDGLHFGWFVCVVCAG